MARRLSPPAAVGLAAIALVLFLIPHRTLGSTGCTGGTGDCGTPALTSQLYGFITTNTTLTFTAPGPIYDVLGDVVVNPGVTLTIEPGVMLRFAANHDTLKGGSYSGLGELWIRGTLSADASAGDSIAFVSSGNGTAQWGQILVEASAAATLRKVSISGAVNALVLLGPGTIEGASIRASNIGVQANAPSSILDVQVADASNGVFLQGPGPYTLTRLTLSNVLHGVWFDVGTAGTLRESVIRGRFSNSGTGLLLSSTASTMPADSTQPIPTEVTGFDRGVDMFTGASARNLLARNNVTGITMGQGQVNYCTTVGNLLYGIWSSGGQLSILNTIAASNAQGGIAEQTCCFGSFADYTDSWNNGGVGAFYNIAVGPNSASFDPFFVDPASGNYRLASNSIFKTFSNSGGEIGAYGPGTCPSTVATEASDTTPVGLRASPNPVRNRTTFRFLQETAGDVTVDVLDVMGRRVRRVTSEFRDAGPQEVAWDTRDDGGGAVPGGLYFWRVASGPSSSVGRLIVIR